MAEALRAVTRPSLLAGFPGILLVGLLLPILAGLMGTLLPAFGYLPALGHTTWGLHIFAELFQQPGVLPALALSLLTGVGSTLLSLVLALSLIGASWHTPWLQRLARGLTALLALPHAALAFGLAFLVAPGGWIARSLGALLNWTTPPGWVTVGDPWGLSLLLGLTLKETPYLLLMALAALPQVRASATLQVATALGHSPLSSWWRAVVPQLLPRLHLPLGAVLAYSISSVDMALILGPGTPPPLAVLLMRFLEAPDLNLRRVAAACGLLLLALTLLAAAGLWGLEWLLLQRFRGWMTRGPQPVTRSSAAPALLLGNGLLIVSGLAVLALALHSFARRWSWPHPLPSQWSLRFWERHLSGVSELAGETLLLGGVATVLALVLSLGTLEFLAGSGRSEISHPGLVGLYLPLLIPQPVFLLGIQTLAVRWRLDGTWGLVLWSHLLFVVPYLFLSLSEAWRQLEPRYLIIARCLGLSRAQVFWRVKVPMLFRPILIACALGFSVSVALYLPTLFAGAGRVHTLTTEAVSRAAGANLRVIGGYALVQALLPLLGLAGALGLSRWWLQNRRGLAA